MLMLIGGTMLAVGAILYVGGRFVGLASLPGDIHIQGEKMGFYFPIVSSILVSILLTAVLNFFARR
jgi:hypothetical protein